MLPQHDPASPAPTGAERTSTRIGVGIDTARYGHYAAFLRPDLQPAAAELLFAESGSGYDQLRQRLALIAQRLGPVHFVIRLDAAGQYADNLLHFLHALRTPVADTPGSPFFTLFELCVAAERNPPFRS